jgi:hypothetical protein
MADIRSNLPVVDTADGSTGSSAPTVAIQVGGTDGTNLRAIKTDTSGRVLVDLFDGSGNTSTIKLANTAASASDTSLVIAQSPISPYTYFHPVFTTRIQSVAVATTVASASLTATLSPTQSGSLLVVNAGRKTSTITITDSSSQTYTLINRLTDGNDNNYFFYKSNSAAGVTSVTITCSTGTDHLILIVSEYSGLTTTPLDKSAGVDNNATTSWSSGLTATTTQASELLIGTAMATQHAATTFVAGSGYLGVNSVTNNTTGANMVAFMEERYVNAIGTYAATGTNSANDNIIANIGTFLTGTLPIGFTFINNATVIKSGAGTLSSININSLGTGLATATFYDNTTNSGTIIAVVSLINSIGSLEYNLRFTTGLTMVVSTNTGDLTVVYN